MVESLLSSGYVFDDDMTNLKEPEVGCHGKLHLNQLTCCG